MKSLVRPELPTASVGSSQATTAAVDNSAPLATRPESTYKSGKVVQTSGATSSTDKEYLATQVYALFENRTKASKTISAQYLAGALENKQLTPEAWRKVQPPYLVEAIDYVTGKVDAALTNGVKSE